MPNYPVSPRPASSSGAERLPPRVSGPWCTVDEHVSRPVAKTPDHSPPRGHPTGDPRHQRMVFSPAEHPGPRIDADDFGSAEQQLTIDAQRLGVELDRQA